MLLWFLVEEFSFYDRRFSIAPMRFIERSNRVKPNKNPITNIRSTSARAGGKRVRLLEKVTGVGRLLHGHCHYRRQEKSRPRSTRSDHLRTMSRPPGVRLAGAVGRGVANGAREIAASRCDNSPIENQAKKKNKQNKRNEGKRTHAVPAARWRLSLAPVVLP